jgi:S1-C subfamily serine protease
MLPVAEGVLIAQVEPHSSAYYARLRKDDIIDEVCGKRINDPSEISSLVDLTS